MTTADPTKSQDANKLKHPHQAHEAHFFKVQLQSSQQVYDPEHEGSDPLTTTMCDCNPRLKKLAEIDASVSSKSNMLPIRPQPVHLVHTHGKQFSAAT